MQDLYAGKQRELWTTAAEGLPPCRGFQQALIQPGLRIIAEIKKASPSKGIIRADFNPAVLAQAYEKGTADCLSVLTDREYFQGDIAYLEQVRNVVSIPLLRKDFIIDELQILEARIHGADAILLIAEALSTEQIQTLTLYAKSLGMDVLLELHKPEEIEKIDFSINTLIGINNRDLTSFRTDLQTTITIKQMLPPQITVVSESGIESREGIHTVVAAGVDAVLVGEHFMRKDNVTGAVQEMKGWVYES